LHSEFVQEVQDMCADTVLQLLALLQIHVVGAAISALSSTDDIKALFHQLDEYAALATVGFIVLRAFVRLCQRTFRTRERRK
jgi:hypothetical protein